MLFRERHPLKAPTPMAVRDSGIVMLFRERHPLKAPTPMVVTGSGIVMLCKKCTLQLRLFAKMLCITASSPMVVTDSGIVILTTESQSRKAVCKKSLSQTPGLIQIDLEKSLYILLCCSFNFVFWSKRSESLLIQSTALQEVSSSSTKTPITQERLTVRIVALHRIVTMLLFHGEIAWKILEWCLLLWLQRVVQHLLKSSLSRIVGHGEIGGPFGVYGVYGPTEFLLKCMWLTSFLRNRLFKQKLKRRVQKKKLMGNLSISPWLEQTPNGCFRK